MSLKPKHQRLVLLVLAAVLVGIGVTTLTRVFHDNLIYFYTPSDVFTQHPVPGKMVRLGGLVEQGSVKKINDGIDFELTDLQHRVHVTYRGTLPALFREGQGVVAEGTLIQGNAEPVLQASRVLAKHDEKYMPPEVAAALKKSGRWRGAK